MDDPAPWHDGQTDSGRLDGWGAWAAAVRRALEDAARHPADLFLFDEDYTRWPLGEKACVDAFETWALARRSGHCTLLARSWEQVPRLHPRWLRWRGPWGHRITCKALVEEEQSAWLLLRPTLLVRDRLGLQLLDSERGAGLWTRRAGQLAEWWQLGDAISQRSVDAMPVTTLGL